MVEEGIVLGHKISAQGIEVDKAKVETIEKLQYPTNVKGIRSFLGHAGFYRRFIQDFSKISKPLCKLLEKDSPFHFTNECKSAFDRLKVKERCCGWTMKLRNLKIFHCMQHLHQHISQTCP